MIKVSIIVPIYNAGFRLYECLDTLVNQTLKEIEIICVLDCPTDGSEKIAEHFAAKDKRIKLIYNKTNLHVAESRNVGMAVAEGEYIGFSDHDDTRRLDMYELLYKSAKENKADITYSDSFMRINGVDKLFSYGNTLKEDIIRSFILPLDHIKNINYLSRNVWGSIYKRDLIIKNKFFFKDKRLYLEEDTLFNLNSFLFSDRVSYVSKPLYKWNIHNNNLSNQWGTNEGLTRLTFFEEMFKLLKDARTFNTYRKEWIISLEDSINTYYSHYKVLPVNQKRRLGQILVRGNFPVLGRYETLKIISKKRLKLYGFVLGLYWNYFIHKHK